MKHTRTLKVIITVFHKFKKLSGDMETWKTEKDLN